MQEKRTIRELGVVTPIVAINEIGRAVQKDTANLFGKALTLTNVCISFVPTGSGFRTSITSAGDPLKPADCGRTALPGGKTLYPTPEPKVKRGD